MKKTIIALFASALTLAACVQIPPPPSDPVAAKKALESMGYTNVTRVAQLNAWPELDKCDQQEALYCNHFEATDRRGQRVSGIVTEEQDGEIEVDHND